VQSPHPERDSAIDKLADAIPGKGAGGAGDRDDALVRELILSRAMVEHMAREHGLVAHYQNRGDFWSDLDEGAGTDDTFDYYRDKVSVTGPSRAGLITLTVRAFAPDQARYFAGQLVVAAQERLNEVLARTALEPVAARKLVMVDGPSLPDRAAYPRRLWSIFTVFVVALALMGVLSMLAGAVREHAKF
jgi:capsule polysaccharide export protein KpsE/RkpR